MWDWGYGFGDFFTWLFGLDVPEESFRCDPSQCYNSDRYLIPG